VKLTREQVARYAEFFRLGEGGGPVIPASSLRGMLRTLVEIVGYGKIERVTGEPRYFFRAVAASQQDPLSQPYRATFGQQGGQVRAGFLEHDRGEWRVRPASEVAGRTFLRVHQDRCFPAFNPPLYWLGAAEYVPVYAEVQYTHARERLERRPGQFIDEVVVQTVRPAAPDAANGWLVTSGDMATPGQRGSTRRRWHYVVPLPDEAKGRLTIDPAALDDYRAALTDFQQGEPFENTKQFPAGANPFSKQDGVLKEGRPIFYIDPPAGQPIRFFGQSPNFRVPYLPRREEEAQGTPRAASPADFVPQALKGADANPVIDLAEAIFGFVRREKQQDGPQAAAGRIAVGHAWLEPGQERIWYGDGERPRTITPRILASPKPTTFQHYLVQTSEQRTADDRRALHHYGSATPGQTVIRGHKLYWHQGDRPGIEHPDPASASASQLTAIQPVRAGVRFAFELWFENLSEVELGALLWVLELAGRDDCRLKLGMGKPLGMGAVGIAHKVFLSDRERRYRHLFGEDRWELGEEMLGADRHEALRAAFERHVLAALPDAGGAGQGLAGRPRIAMLLAMLRWPGLPANRARYLGIEHPVGDHPLEDPVRPSDQKVNEYRFRRVLPDPLWVVRNEVVPSGANAPGGRAPHASDPRLPRENVTAAPAAAEPRPVAPRPAPQSPAGPPSSGREYVGLMEDWIGQGRKRCRVKLDDGTIVEAIVPASLQTQVGRYMRVRVRLGRAEGDHFVGEVRAIVRR
jgi:CRISPR-associated protein (TIGR03986 family)